MKAIDVANYLIEKYGDQVEMTNLKLNKLVYFAQAISLQKFGRPLFDGEIQAWNYGPVEPDVYQTFKAYGRMRIDHPAGVVVPDDFLSNVAQCVMTTYGSLTAFDLVRLSHREGSAWKTVYRDDVPNVPITQQDILASSDGIVSEIGGGTLAQGIKYVQRSWPNAMRMLENS